MSVRSHHREANLDFLYSRVIWVAVLVCILSGLAGITYNRGLSYALIALSSEQSTGEITWIIEKRGDYTYGYEFTDSKEKTFTGEFVFDSFYDQTKYNLEDKVEIIYASIAPKYSKPLKFREKNDIDFYFFVFSLTAIFLCLCYILYTLLQITKYKSEDKYH